MDAVTGEGVEAIIIVSDSGGAQVSEPTDERGRFTVALPSGRYTIRAFAEEHHGARLEDLALSNSQVRRVRLVLSPLEEEDITVSEYEVVYEADTTSALAQLNLRRESTSVQDSVGAEEISRSGDGSASSAARRVVGVDVDANSRLAVRGLGGRYSRVLLNGVSVPSTDPDVPGVQLDLFPTDMLRSISVMKTFRPDVPANWAGGLMQINTAAIPDEFVLSGGISLGSDTLTGFADRLDYGGGSLDALGFDDGARGLPDGFPNERLELSRQGRFQSRDELEGAARTLGSDWEYGRHLALPNLGASLTFGNSHGLGGDTRFGYLVSLGYDRSVSRRLGEVRADPVFDESGELVERSRYSTETGQDEVRWGGLGALGLELGDDHTITYLTMFNRSATDETQLQQGYDGGLDASSERWQLRQIARTIFFNQLLGDHKNLGGTRLRLRWNGYVSSGARDEPDTRTVQYADATGVRRWIEKSSSGSRFFSELSQLDAGGGFNLRLPLWESAWATVGGQAGVSDRTLTNRRFRMLQSPSVIDQAQLAQPANTLFGPEGIGPLTRIDELTRADDSYVSTIATYSVFAMIETPLGGGLRLATGARLEAVDQSVESRSPFVSERDQQAPRTDRLDLDVLPSVSLTYPLGDEMNLRAAYAMTVARPQIRELAPYQYYDFVRNRNIAGNPELQRTQIHNADLRWEWFFGAAEESTELVAISAFYKRFVDPIELIILNPENRDSRFENTTAADNVGVEAETRVSLGRIDESLRDLSLGVNFSLLYSQVDIPQELATAVSSERRLFGQAPYVANISLRYDNEEAGLSLGLLYNVSGPRITDVGVRVADRIAPNLEQQPVHQLDLVGSLQLTPQLGLKLKARNLLHQAPAIRQGDFVIQSARPVTSFSLSANLSY